MRVLAVGDPQDQVGRRATPGRTRCPVSIRWPPLAVCIGVDHLRRRQRAVGGLIVEAVRSGPSIVAGVEPAVGADGQAGELLATARSAAATFSNATVGSTGVVGRAGGEGHGERHERGAGGVAQAVGDLERVLRVGVEQAGGRERDRVAAAGGVDAGGDEGVVARAVELDRRRRSAWRRRCPCRRWGGGRWRRRRCRGGRRARRRRGWCR